MEFITVVHKENIGLLRLTALAVAGRASIWRVYVQDDSIDLVRECLAPWPGISVETAPNWSRRPGWIAQQLTKLWAAGLARGDWVTIVGPGNMPLMWDQCFFAPSGRAWIQLDTAPTLRKFQVMWDRLDSGLARPSILTPWMWHVPTVRSALARSQPLDQWTDHFGLEQYFYWSHAGHGDLHQPGLLVQGIEHYTGSLSARLKQHYRENPAPWWVLHRTAYQNDPASVEFTLEILESHLAITSSESAEYWVDYLKGRWR